MIGILGNGFFGAGMRAVQDREANILRRFKVTPIGPLPILLALASGWLLTFPLSSSSSAWRTSVTHAYPRTGRALLMFSLGVSPFAPSA